MAKIKVPLLSLDARGTLSKAITYVKRKAQNIAEKKPEIIDVKSPAQLSWRHMYQKAVALWHALSAAEKEEWESLARPKHMTGFAWFMSQALKPNPGLYLPLQGGTMAGDIDMAKYRLLRLPAPADPQEALRLIEYTANIAPYLYNEGARVYHNIDQAIPNTTWTVSAFNSERWDSDTIHDTVVNNDRLTCKTAGKYLVSFSGRFAADNVGRRMFNLRLNIAVTIAFEIANAVDGGTHGITITTVVDLAVTDFVDVRVYQDSGGPLNLISYAADTPEFMMQRVAA